MKSLYLDKDFLGWRIVFDKHYQRLKKAEL